MPANSSDSTIQTVEMLVQKRFGFTSQVRQLDGERDWNFLVHDRTSNRQYVLKLFAPSEDPAFVAAEIAVQQRLLSFGLPVPEVVPTIRQEFIFESGIDGQKRQGRLVTLMPGSVLAKRQVIESDFWGNFGGIIGNVSTALSGFDHTAIHREFLWDLAKSEAVVRENLSRETDAGFRDLLQQVIAGHAEAMNRITGPLRQSVVHGDMNDWNVFTSPVDPAGNLPQSVTGIIDFGDMVWSDSINDLAVAIAYAVLDRPDPLDIACRMVASCHRQWPLTPDERQLLWHRVRLRLATSVVMAAKQLVDDSNNDYLGISQMAIRRTLPGLLNIPAVFTHAAFCQACGQALPGPIDNARRWLDSNTGRFHPPVRGLKSMTPLLVDWSVTTGLFDGDPAELQTPLENATVQLLESAPGSPGVGGWGEPRLVYQAAQFGTGDGSPPRTVHLGVDVFAPAGTEIVAPLDGTIHSLDVIDLPLDYGGVVLTRHESSSGEPVLVLYGHLDPASIAELKPGQKISGGQTIARLGDRDVNGGWIPHLHLQILADDFGLGTGFPGVCQATWKDLWLQYCPNPAPILGLNPKTVAHVPVSTETLAGSRRKLIGRSVRTSYRDPVQLVRGWMQYVYDENGRRYLDAYNNVPHVGHCHPRIIEAATRQMKLLNSNTRYVSRLQTEFAERLTATMPDGLEVCFILNSASEANELALRLARTATGGRDMIVNEHAYHGNTTSLIDISPYKHNGRGGEGPPDWVHAVPIPDTWRGEYRNNDPDAGRKYASHVSLALQSIESRGGKLAGFIAETCPSVGGQIIPPADYLPNVYKLIRAAGGICIADEVQTGYGRMGDCFYAFERSGVVPDVVVLGKPIGNGHPLAAVVTSHAIADAFDNGMEYFSTFGGNHVSCAVGIAVLDVVQSEGLQQHAQSVGEVMRSLFHSQPGSHPLVGDIRGNGLFWGIELVRDSSSLEPATAEASWIKNQLRHRGILIGTDGHHDNVLKIRPPMPFDKMNVGQLVEALGEVLASL